MTGRLTANARRLKTLLKGGIPDAPPHWELVFQIPGPMFGMSPPAEANLAFHIDVCQRLIDECDWAAVPPPNSYDADSIRRMKEELGHRVLIPGYEGSGVFWMLPGSEAMEFAVRLYERPDELQAEARSKCDAAKERLRVMADAGADFFVLTYDFGFNNAPFISPRHFRDLVTPYLTEIVQTAHDLGKVAILHSDGCLNEIIDQLHSTGLDGYHSIDPQGHMDIKVVREQYPDWILMGNVNCAMLQDGTEAEIRGSVRYCMQHGGIGSRYILSTSNCVYAGMPPENYRIMLDEYRRCIERHGSAS